MSAGVPAVSVIVPFLDARPYLARSVDSLLDQSLPRNAYELLFVDNGSTDGGEALVAARPGVRLLREEKRGAYAARNRGVAEASGEILAFTDPDCEAEREWLERIAAAIGEPGVGIVIGHRLAAAEDGLLDLVMAYESQKAAYVIRRGDDEVLFGHTNNMAVRRGVMEAVGPFLEIDRGGDTVLVHRAVATYGRGILRYHPEIRVRHLEMTGLARYYGKSGTYGRSNERLRELVPFRPLTTRERWGVFRSTLRERGWSPLRGATLLAVLAVGMLGYEGSRLLARIRGWTGGRRIVRG
ncbi:MAG: glycosyltransferase [Gemmatimonadetes bacterium]|nr:glycosyltransferase [Gemmatimonadota bacterium]